MSATKSFSLWASIEKHNTLRSRGKSTVQSKSELTNNAYIGCELAKSEQIDVLSAMHTGCKLLKLCSRRTRSHWRKFQLDPSNRSIQWVSDKKDVNDTTIYISNIIEIICHNRNVVEKFKDTLPEDLTSRNYDELQQQQFTIRYIESNKHLYSYLPQLSPNHSLTNNTMQQSSLSILKPPILHQANNSNSFIRSLRNNNNNQNQLFQPDFMIENDDDSSSNPSNKCSKKQNRRRSGSSFWKHWLKKNENKENKEKNSNSFKEKEKEKEKSFKSSSNEKEKEEDDVVGVGMSHYLSQSHHHERNYTDTVNTNSYHIQELHLIAESIKHKTIWVYGLERLMEVNKNGIDLSLIPSSQFQISTKELMNYSINKGRESMNEFMNEFEQSIVTPFKVQLDAVNDGLYNVIEQLPQTQQLILEDKKINIDILQNNYLMRKIRQDQNDLDYILHQVSKGRFDKESIKNWSYILTRIEINIGGYQIAINNQKQIKYQQCQSHQSLHKRERSKSSSIYSNYQQSPFQPPFCLQQQTHSNTFKHHHKTTRSSREFMKNNNMLKDRAPRSPPIISHAKIDDFNNILRAPISPHLIEKYDSV